MSFVQSTASTIDDALSQMCAFAVAHAGFADANGGSIPNRYKVSKGGIFWTFAPSSFNGINHAFGRMSYSVAADADPTALNGQHEWTSMSTYRFFGPYPTLYLFTEGTCVFMVLELTTGAFAHLCFGVMEKIDTFEGGEFIAATHMDSLTGGSPNLFLHIDNAANCPPFTGSKDSKYGSTYNAQLRIVQTLAGKQNNADDWAPFGAVRGQKTNQVIGSSWGGFSQILFDRSPNTATGRSILLPQNIFAFDYVTGLYNFLGSIPGTRVVNIGKLDAGEIVLNDWQVFPLAAKDGDRINYSVTYGYGVAYKRVP